LADESRILVEFFFSKKLIKWNVSNKKNVWIKNCKTINRTKESFCLRRMLNLTPRIERYKKIISWFFSNKTVFVSLIGVKITWCGKNQKSKTRIDFFIQPYKVLGQFKSTAIMRGTNNVACDSGSTTVSI
jgi:hypothetical protein